jgi:hypothetical protein
MFTKSKSMANHIQLKISLREEGVSKLFTQNTIIINNIEYLPDKNLRMNYTISLDFVLQIEEKKSEIF